MTEWTLLGKMGVQVGALGGCRKRPVGRQGSGEHGGALRCVCGAGCRCGSGETDGEGQASFSKGPSRDWALRFSGRRAGIFHPALRRRLRAAREGRPKAQGGSQGSVFAQSRAVRERPGAFTELVSACLRIAFCLCLLLGVNHVRTVWGVCVCRPSRGFC